MEESKVVERNPDVANPYRIIGTRLWIFVHQHPPINHRHTRLCFLYKTNSHFTMLQQRLARSLQSASRHSPAPALRTATFTSPAVRLRLAPAASRRWYSENTAASKEESSKEQAETETKEAPKQEGDAENPLKAELEAKKEQNKDLTVG